MSLSPQLKSHFAGTVTTLATCWKLTRRDNKVLGFTDFESPIKVDDIIYDSVAGFTASSIESTSNLAVDNLDLSGQLYLDKISKADLLAGLYDFARLEIFLVNYKSPSSGKLMQKRGILGQVTIIKNSFYAEVRGLTQSLSQTITEIYMPQCRANLGDKRCKVNLNNPSFTVNTQVSEVQDSGSLQALSSRTFKTSSLTQSPGWFNGGYVIWNSGSNKGLKTEIKEFASNVITLALPMPYSINEGDKLTAVVGCDKSKSTCINKFGNIINFRGEPDLPGSDKLYSSAGTR